MFIPEIQKILISSARVSKIPRGQITGGSHQVIISQQKYSLTVDSHHTFTSPVEYSLSRISEAVGSHQTLFSETQIQLVVTKCSNPQQKSPSVHSPAEHSLFPGEITVGHQVIKAQLQLMVTNTPEYSRIPDQSSFVSPAVSCTAYHTLKDA